MNNMIVVLVVGAFYAFISEVSLSLGITTTKIEYPTGLFDSITNNVNSFLQLAFFQADMPAIFNSLIFAPVLLMFIYLAIVVLRGGAN